MAFGRIPHDHPLSRLREELDRAFGNVLDEVSDFVPFGRSGGFPAVNLWEDDRNLYAEAELPGMSLENVEVLVMGNELTLKGERRDNPPEGAAYHRRERGAGTFTRVVRLPIDVNAEGVEATLRDGVLTVTLPKTEKARPRKIQVK